MAKLKLKEYRERVGLSQDQVAKILNIDRSTLSRYENGSRQVKPEMLRKLAHLYQTTPEKLLGAVEDKDAIPHFNSDDINQTLERVSKLLRNMSLAAPSATVVSSERHS